MIHPNPMSVVRTMYHTQEKRGIRLDNPIICVRDDAWLGNGYYFWNELDDAEQWGQNSKRKTGRYEIYKATIDCIDVLDTVFNEEHYQFWLKQVEKAAKVIWKKTGEKPTLKELNAYFQSRGGWGEAVAGILFQDLPGNPTYLLVHQFSYRKRIQIAVYKLDIITNFVFLDENTCS